MVEQEVHGGLYSSSTGSSGTGGGGYPAAGIGGGGAGGGGGDHANGGGGYSGGMGEFGSSGIQNVNGENGYGETLPRFACGTSYFTLNTMTSSLSSIFSIRFSQIGGQGGQTFANEYGQSHCFWSDSGGDGGVAGMGGIIRASTNSRIYAYNGNKYTDSKTVAEHNYNNGLNQCPIYIQNGVLRSIYKTNQWWGQKLNKNYNYFYGLLGERLVSSTADIVAATSYLDIDNYEIREEYTETGTDYIVRTEYVNPQTNTIYGVGSGAGYIEVSNGSYKEYDSMN